MADYEKGLLARVLFKRELQDVIDRRIEPKMLADEKSRKAFEFVLDFYKKYGDVPSIDLVEQEFPELKLGYAKEPVGYYIDKLVEQYVRNRGSYILTENARLLVTNPMNGLEMLRSEFARLTVEANPTRDVNLVETMNERKKRYLELKNLKGIDGYPTPWEVLNEATMGWHAGEFISIVARPAVGKTFMLVVFAEYAWANGLSVLFINNEMSEEQIGKRFDAVHFKLPYKEFRAGLLPDELEKKYFEGLEELEGENPIWVISDVSGVMSIASKIDQYKPDIVMIDGMYLLNDDRRGDSRWERMTNTSRDLKKLAQQKKVPIVATTQFNRATDETRVERVTLSNIGFSDSLGQDCLPKGTLIWSNRGLVRLDELDEEKDRVWDGEQFRRFKVLKEKEKEIYEVRLKNDGQVFRCSGDHGLLVMSKKPELEWKKAKDLSPGDYVVRTEHVLEAGVEHKMSWKYSPVSSALKTVRIPDKVDEDVAELLGIMVAEGWYAAKKDNTMSIAFGRKEVETRQYYAGLIEKLFGYVPKHKQNPKKNVDSLLIHSTEIIRWLRSVGLEGKTAREKTVPWTILQGTPEIRKAFLRGLFTGDGTVEKSGIVSTVSGSEKLTQQVYQLLRSLGFTPTIREHVMKSNGHSYWRIKVRAADAWKFKEIGIRGDEKERRLDKRDDGVLIERQFGFDEVESIKATGVVESMYDLNVEESHRFVAEGLMVHNSDVVLGLFRTRDMELNNEMLVRMLKVREGQPVDFNLLWDLRRMEFKVIATQDENQFIDDEEGDEVDF